MATTHETHPSHAASEPLVSVIIPFKNAGPFFREAVESVLAQSWARLEILLVDDGGSDGSAALACELAASHVGRVRVLAHESRANLGTGPSRALGIRAARGQLTAFLDADDVWEPNHLADDIALLLAHPEADMVCGRVWTWRSWADPAAEDTLSQLAFTPGLVVPPPRLLAAVLRNGGVATATCALLVRTDAVRACAAQVERFPSTYEDQVINSWLQLRVTAVMSGGTSAWYRQHGASLTAHDLVRREARDGGRMAFLTWLQKQVDECGPSDPEVDHLLERAVQEVRRRAAARQRPRGVRALRRLSRVVRRPAAAVRRALTDEPASLRAEHVEGVLFRYGADIRGDVLVVGAAGQVGATSATNSVELLRPSPFSSTRGPHHEWASLRSLAYDCVVVLMRGTTGTTGSTGSTVELELRHLRRSLRPGGVLLLVIARPDPQAQQTLREVFGRDAVSMDTKPESGIHPQLTLLRAAVPAP